MVAQIAESAMISREESSLEKSLVIEATRDMNRLHC